jgi:uncharacterized membrane protein YgcG
MVTAAATTEPAPSPARARHRGEAGPDRLTVALLAVAGFLAVLALLAWQMSWSAASTGVRPAIVLRRVYENTVIETLQGSGSGGRGSSVTQSVSSSGSSSPSSGAPTTRTSSAP